MTTILLYGYCFVNMLDILLADWVILISLHYSVLMCYTKAKRLGH